MITLLFFFKCRKFHVEKVLIQTYVKFHIPNPIGLNTMMFKIIKECIVKHTSLSQLLHNIDEKAKENFIQFQ